MGGRKGLGLKMSESFAKRAGSLSGSGGSGENIQDLAAQDLRAFRRQHRAAMNPDDDEDDDEGMSMMRAQLIREQERATAAAKRAQATKAAIEKKQAEKVSAYPRVTAAPLLCGMRCYVTAQRCRSTWYCSKPLPTLPSAH